MKNWKELFTLVNNMDDKKIDKEQRERLKAMLKRWKDDPLEFIKDNWKLVPERDNEKFVKGKHLTWQQHDILLAVKKALDGTGSKRISIRSGHGIGKSTTFAWLIIWYLFTHKEAQVPCTAPTSDQIYDVLWKEQSKWLEKLPAGTKCHFKQSQQYLRMVDQPSTWFARAKTARKEKPEALAGVHGDYVMMVVDEASGVANEIFNTAEGALTNENVLVLMISNPTRLNGYFYDSHHKDKANWQTLGFSCIDSPIVDHSYVERIKSKHGEDSDEYRIRVLGLFPREDAMDDKGYVPLLTDSMLKFGTVHEFVGKRWLGIDPAGQGRNETVWVLRDNFRTKVLKRDKISNEKDIAKKTITFMHEYDVKPENIIVDNFGVGANVATELAFVGIRVTPINVGDVAHDTETYLNLRAEMFYKMRIWLKEGGELLGVDKWDDLLKVRMKRNLRGKVQIMSKDEMRREGIESPDTADALMLTFLPQRVSIRHTHMDIAALEDLDYSEGWD